MLKILITAPSLNENENVSGISTMVRTIIHNNKSSNNFIHYRVGKRDGEGKGIKWAFGQVTLIPHLVSTIIRKKINLVYLNTDLTRASVVRDYFLFSAAKYLLRKKVLLHIHGGHFLMEPPASGSPFLFIIKTMLKSADLCIVLSEIEQQSIKNNYGVSGVALPNAIEVENIKNEVKDFENKLRIIFLGRVVASKGIYLIAEALIELKPYFNDFDFHIYGSGPELDTLLKKLETVEGLKYTYHGIVKGSKKWEALDQAHVFLLPSLYGEGLPIAMLEAMGRGCIPVVSDDASISSVVMTGDNGYIVKKGDYSDLAEKIQRLLQNRNLMPEMSVKARSTIRHKYDIDSYLNRLNQYCINV
jgi:glycosyltransferase involved in cell wall biosynthesis